jgi:hypothetical protein
MQANTHKMKIIDIARNAEDSSKRAIDLKMNTNPKTNNKARYLEPRQARSDDPATPTQTNTSFPCSFPTEIMQNDDDLFFLKKTNKHRKLSFETFSIRSF